MNNAIETTDAIHDEGGRSIGSFGYGIGISVGLLAILAIITYGSCICTPRRSAVNRHPSAHGSSIDTTTNDGSTHIQEGLDEATLLTYPKLLYSDAKLHKGDPIASGCSICLAEYKDTDMLRLLPDFSHLFHQKCVDPWFKLHRTCPICRTSPLPTPLAEFLPSAPDS
ncbi:unnamed protein product [Ilex paraguariensis]|uniref:RING-type E3 ubiquitin transferase n=1 Tax=Ilex paraguariensis TaxID=185542 RepID=A0ABC8UIT3_9AQUA